MKLFGIALLVAAHHVAGGHVFNEDRSFGEVTAAGHKRTSNSMQHDKRQQLGQDTQMRSATKHGSRYNSWDIVRYLCNQKEAQDKGRDFTENGERNMPGVATGTRSGYKDNRNNNNKSTPRKGLALQIAGPVQNLKTPNFEIQILSEDGSNAEWRKYARFFQPIKNFRNLPSMEIGYPQTRGPGTMESVLSSLGGKQHIIILYPRYCFNNVPFINRGSIRPGNNDLRYRNEFEKEFLPTILKHLKEQRPGYRGFNPRTEENKINEDDSDIDRTVERILNALEHKESPHHDSDNRRPPNGSGNEVSSHLAKFCHHVVGQSNRANAFDQSAFGSEVQYRKTKRFVKDGPNTCKNGYLFLVQNQNGSIHDVLLRVLQFVKKAI